VPGAPAKCQAEVRDDDADIENRQRRLRGDGSEGLADAGPAMIRHYI
jgi:hypothetical protein